MSAKFQFFIFFFGFVVCSVLSAQWHTEPSQHPDYPDQCYDDETNEPISVGSNHTLPGCILKYCEPDFRFAVQTCAPFNVPPGCKDGEPDLSRLYPDCCPKPIC